MTDWLHVRPAFTVANLENKAGKRGKISIEDEPKSKEALLAEKMEKMGL